MGDNQQMQFDVAFIKKVLPHRYPFLLIDRILELRKDYVKSLKNVTINEEFFNGHFPERPVMPGVLMLEALAQNACFMAYQSLQDSGRENFDLSVLFTGIENARFRKVVIPGDQLILECTLIKTKRDVWWIDAKATVEGKIACEASMSALCLGTEKGR